MFVRNLVAALLVGCVSLTASAETQKVRRIPAVVKTLGKRYQLPTPVTQAPGGVPGARDLADLVAIEQRCWPGAVVTAGFYDWRTLSVYRGHAGLHFGYDIAMPYGNQFAAGWTGTVTSIVNWYGEQYGITVAMADGSSVTYGHVSPRVSVGTHVEPGMVLGTIALDHVDVKMRDASGNYVDFGGNGRVVPSPGWASGFSLPEPSRESVMAGWLLAQNALELAQEDLSRETFENEKRKIELQGLRKKVPALKESQKLMADYVEQGLVSRVTAEENREQLDVAKRELALKEKQLKNNPGRLKELQRAVSQAKNKRAEAQKAAAARGITWKQVENFVQATVASDRSLSKNVSAYKRSALNKNGKRVSQLETDVKRSNETLKNFQELYEMGGISRNELDDARQKNALLKAQLKALKGESRDGI